MAKRDIDSYIDSAHDLIKDLKSALDDAQSESENMIDDNEFQEKIIDAQNTIRKEIIDLIDEIEFVNNANSCTPQYIKDEIIKAINTL